MVLNKFEPLKFYCISLSYFLGYIPHQETGIEIVRSDTPVKNGGLQQMSTEHSSRNITKKQGKF